MVLSFVNGLKPLDPEENINESDYSESLSCTTWTQLILSVYSLVNKRLHVPHQKIWFSYYEKS